MYEFSRVFAGVRFACVSDVHVCENFKCVRFSYVPDVHACNMHICKIFKYVRFSNM